MNAFLESVAAVYGAATTTRRRWYARDPARRRWLSQPVISVGNLRVGGSGKTPVVEAIVRLLVSRSERPSILTRGYARRKAADGVTVVCDGSAILADVDRAGDEALMMARHFPMVPVLVGANRYLAGLLAERQFGATVHVLDDGFQHLALGRDVDLLMTGSDDLQDRVLPAGRLREPLGAAVNADAGLVNARSQAEADHVRQALRLPAAFFTTRTLGLPRPLRAGATIDVGSVGKVVAAAGVGQPARFFADLAPLGWHVAGTVVFADHHPYTQEDVDRIAAAARSAGTSTVLTTEKDAVKLERCRLDGLVVASVPLTTTIEPEDAFASWLEDRLTLARSGPHARRSVSDAGHSSRNNRAVRAREQRTVRATQAR